MVDAENHPERQGDDQTQLVGTVGNSDANDGNTRCERGEQQQDSDGRRRERRMEWFTGIIAAATLIYAGISAWQLITMKQQLLQQQTDSRNTTGQINRQLAKINYSVYEQGVLARAEGKAALAARQAVETAVASLNENKAANSEQIARLDKNIAAQLQVAEGTSKTATATNSSFLISSRQLEDHEAEQRANVALNGSVAYAGSTITVSADARNIGATRAQEVRLVYHFQGFPPGSSKASVRSRQDDTFRQLMKDFRANAIAARFLPESVANLSPNANVTPKGTIPNISADTWNAMKSTPGGWVFTARVTYDDIYGVSHWTDICTYQAGGDTAVYCPRHNDQGDYVKPHVRPLKNKPPGEPE